MIAVSYDSYDSQYLYYKRIHRRLLLPVCTDRRPLLPRLRGTTPYWLRPYRCTCKGPSPQHRGQAGMWYRHHRRRCPRPRQCPRPLRYPPQGLGACRRNHPRQRQPPSPQSHVPTTRPHGSVNWKRRWTTTGVSTASSKKT